MSLLEFWKVNPQYWIAIENKSEADQTITENFYNTHKIANWIERVIYLDQFSRHFQRYFASNNIESNIDINHWREQACCIVIENSESIINVDEIELIFCLMPFKHTNRYKYIFNIIHNLWLPKDKKISDYQYLCKFYYDTYQKAYTVEEIRLNIIDKHNVEEFDRQNICEYYSLDYCKSDNLHLFPNLPRINNPIISLSGGVDSMVLLYYYKVSGYNPRAIHIVYGNRTQSTDEYNFLVEFCNNLQIPLYVYKIEYIRRNIVDRDWYENITRDIRFMVYRSVGGDNANILLGHIRDDVVENIWTNFATCRHLDNLKRMTTCETQMGVNIWRPFIDTNKSDILNLAHLIGIPYLKNTTPSWSNRGKYREYFYKAICQQYGDDSDTSVIQAAEMIASQNRVINDLLYKPIINSYYDILKEENKILNNTNFVFDVTLGIDNKISILQWEQIFHLISHQIIKINKPSIHSVTNFYKMLNRLTKSDEICVQLKKNIQAFVTKYNNKYYLKIVLQ